MERELLRRVVKETVRASRVAGTDYHRWVELDSSDADAIIDRVLADAPPLREAGKKLDAILDAIDAACARGVAGERERWMQAVTSLVGYETASAVRDDVDRVAQEVKRD